MVSAIELGAFRPAGAVYVYGSRETGLALRATLSALGIECHGFIDSFQAGEADGLPVLRLDQYLQVRRSDDVILIASAADLEIGRTLEAHGIKDYYSAVRLDL